MLRDQSAGQSSETRRCAPSTRTGLPNVVGRKRFHERVKLAVRQIDDQEVRLALYPVDDDQRFANRKSA